VEQCIVLELGSLSPLPHWFYSAAWLEKRSEYLDLFLARAFRHFPLFSVGRRRWQT
jgi:hypothetical protein